MIYAICMTKYVLLWKPVLKVHIHITVKILSIFPKTDIQVSICKIGQHVSKDIVWNHVIDKKLSFKGQPSPFYFNILNAG